MPSRFVHAALEFVDVATIAAVVGGVLYWARGPLIMWLNTRRLRRQVDKWLPNAAIEGHHTATAVLGGCRVSTGPAVRGAHTVRVAIDDSGLPYELLVRVAHDQALVGDLKRCGAAVENTAIVANVPAASARDDVQVLCRLATRIAKLSGSAPELLRRVVVSSAALPSRERALRMLTMSYRRSDEADHAINWALSSADDALAIVAAAAAAPGAAVGRLTRLALDSRDPAVRLQACKLCAAQGVPELERITVSALKSGPQPVRSWARTQLRRRPQPAAANALMAGLGDATSADIRIELMQALAALPPESLPPGLARRLVPLVGGSSLTTALAAAEALGRCGGPEHIDVLLRTAASNDEHSLIAACRAAAGRLQRRHGTSRDAGGLALASDGASGGLAIAGAVEGALSVPEVRTAVEEV